jgi:hypothetical protein
MLRKLGIKVEKSSMVRSTHPSATRPTTPPHA